MANNINNMDYTVLVNRLFTESQKYRFYFSNMGNKVIVRFIWKGKSFPLIITPTDKMGEDKITFWNKNGHCLSFDDAFEAHYAFWNIWKKLKKTNQNKA